MLALHTVGHSNQPMARLLDLLSAHGIRTLVDIRTIPRSRRNPQFAQAALREALAAAAITYRHLPALGGLRTPAPDSANLGWREPGFRGFADHMASAEFAAGLAELESIARADRTVIMCAEASPRHCH